MAIRYQGTGQTYATIALAIAACAAGDSVCIRSTGAGGTVTEDIILNTNIAGIFSDNGSIWSSTGSNTTLTIQSGLTQALTIYDLTITKTSGLDNTITWASAGVGSSVKFLTCELRTNRTTGAYRDILKIDAALIAAEQLTVERCIIRANANTGGGITNATATVTANTILVKNCIFIGNTQTDITGIKMNLSTLTNIANIYNCTFYGWDAAVNFAGKTTTTNCMFVGNDTDKIISGLAAKTDFNTCGFAQQTDDGGWNAGTIFGLVLANELVNAAGGDFNLKALAQCIDTGTTISSVTNGYNNAVRPRGLGYDIGATEYQKFVLT